MASPAPDSYASASGVPIYGGISIIRVAQEIVGNGAWTWFTDPRAVYRDGATYIGWVSSTGTCGVSKYTHATGATESFNLIVNLQVDDHNNTSIHFAQDGRIVCFYCAHADARLRCRVSVSPGSVSDFGAEIGLTAVASPISYSNPHYLSKSGKTYVHYRGGGGTDYEMNALSTSNYSTWDAERTWIVEVGQRPYVKSTSNGYDRIDFAFTNCHPASAYSSIYHCYMQLDASNNELFYKSDGTLIGSVVTPAQATLVYDGSTYKSWIHQIAYDSVGAPVVLFARFLSPNNHRYNYAKLSGATWSSTTEICAAGVPIYASETYYSGGICFDGKDKNTIYLSTKVGSYFEIQKYSTHDSGATWQKQLDITSGSTENNCRPFSPENYGNDLSVLWWAGTYTSYVSYNTKIKGFVLP